MEDKPKVRIYTDGAAEPNPGKGGWAAILLYKGAVRELSGAIDHCTNNYAEIWAAIKGLEALKKPCEVVILSDSKYLVNTINLRWRRNANLELWERLEFYCEKKGHSVTFEWIKGHNGDHWNERANDLAQKHALKRA